MIKLGFELEAFVFNQNQEAILVPNDLPYDECGWLAEVRSEPNADVVRAVYLLRAETTKVLKDAQRLGVVLDFSPLYPISRELKVQAARRFGKGRLAYRNLYGHETHRCSSKFATASLHVSFTNQQEFHYTDQDRQHRIHKHNGFVDHAKYVSYLDRAFKEEIKVAKRNPGFYEVKSDGRIEYRSLPNNVDLDKLTTVLVEMLA